jgi:WS/DGAT/MGAT family acyltransferase
MRQLTGLDASFVYLENPKAPMHIGSFAIYDPSTAAEPPTFDDILKHFERRLAAVPTTKERLVRVPLDLDHPYWVTDDDFDLEFHVRQLALGKPGTWQQLCTQVARLHARPLDLSKPPWEYYVIEGLDAIDGVPKGSFALYSKVHHAGIDGASGAELTAAIHDLGPEPGDVAPVPSTPDRLPNALELLTRAGFNNLAQPFRLARLTRRTIRRTVANLGRLQGQSSTTAPRTRFSGPISAHRSVDGRTFSLPEVKQIRLSLPGATVNDVVLAVIAGALRTYLAKHDDLPSVPMQCMAPISVRTEGEVGTMGNRVSAMRVAIPTDVADAAERLRRVHEATSQAKEMTEAIGARTLSDYSQFVPWQLAGMASRIAARANLAARTTSPVNTVVTNVPGPQIPLYLAGAHMVNMYGLGIPTDGVGLFHTVFSYAGTITITVTADREQLPDPGLYADCLEEAFHDQVVAAGLGD